MWGERLARGSSGQAARATDMCNHQERVIDFFLESAYTSDRTGEHITMSGQAARADRAFDSFALI